MEVECERDRNRIADGLAKFLYRPFLAAPQSLHVHSAVQIEIHSVGVGMLCGFGAEVGHYLVEALSRHHTGRQAYGIDERHDLKPCFLKEVGREKRLLRLFAVQDVEVLLPRLCGGERVRFALKRSYKYFCLHCLFGIASSQGRLHFTLK